MSDPVMAVLNELQSIYPDYWPYLTLSQLLEVEQTFRNKQQEEQQAQVRAARLARFSIHPAMQ